MDGNTICAHYGEYQGRFIEGMITWPAKEDMTFDTVPNISLWGSVVSTHHVRISLPQTLTA